MKKIILVQQKISSKYNDYAQLYWQLLGEDFDLALEEQLMSTFQPQVKSIYNLFKESEELKEFINSQGVPSDAKKDFFDKLLKNKVHTYVLHFLCLLIDKKRERKGKH